MKIAIVTDSNSGITQKEGKELGISVIPMPFMADGKTYFEDIDLATFFVYKKEIELLDKIIIHDLYVKILHEISMLNEPNKTIANLIFIENMSIRNVAKVLGVKNSTIIYHKKQIQQIIQKKIKKFLPLDK